MTGQNFKNLILKPCAFEKKFFPSEIFSHAYKISMKTVCKEDL